MSSSDHDQDVPYGEDWQSIAEATAWADASDKKRPWRAQRRVLYMTEQEQLDTLAAAGFSAPSIELSLNGLVLYSGRKTDPSLQRT